MNAFAGARPSSLAGWYRPRSVWLAAFGLLLGVGGGVAVARLGPTLPIILLAGVVAASLVAIDPRWGLAATLAVVTLLPFGTLPFKVGATPTLLELALGGTWVVFGLRLLLQRDRQLVTSALDVPLVLFVTVTLFAFVLGLSIGYTSQTIHDYGKLVLAISGYFLILNLVRGGRDLSVALTALVAAGTAAAWLGLALYALGPRAINLLARLAIVGYPTGKILRYIEDDPAKALRATGTGVDPNSFAGMLMIVLAIGVGQAVARQPMVPRALSLLAIPPVGLALLLTYSRAAWLGAAGAVFMLAVLRYRWLLAPLAGGALLAQGLGLGQKFAQRLILGLQLKDPATKLRLAEYQNALAIIREHPVFGVGFGAAPAIDRQTGVSSIYLTIAERAGLLGLGLFVLVVGLVLWQAARALRSRAAAATPAGEALLALTAALAAALAAGALDHYFFHIGFAHMVAIFWALCALVVVAARTALTPSGVGADGTGNGVNRCLA